jgi:soluble lytic murein transglycosylase-like protein
MTLLDVVDRIQQLNTQLGLVRPASANGGSDFAAALAQAGGAAGGSASVSGHTGSDVVADARRYLGVPYVFGGTDPTTGLDCSGLVQRVYGDLGIKLPRLADEQARVGQPVASLDQARPGDLLAFNTPVDHIAIYIGDGKMIAAPQPGENVKIQDVYQTPSVIRRVIADAPPVLPAVRPAALRSVPYADVLSQAASANGLPGSLLAAVAQVESGFNPQAVSPAGAQGLMQLMPSTAAGLGVDPFDPRQAADGAARLLARDLRDFGSLPLALAAYNAGAGAVRQYGGIPPYAETQAYVGKVQSAMAAIDARGLR